MGSTLSLRSRNTATGDAQSEYDAATNETVTRYCTAILDEDFCGPGHTTVPTQGSPAAGYAWVQRIVGAAPPTCSIVANYPGGLIRLALASNSEAEEADLYANDMLNWDMTKSAIFECRVSNHVLPTLVAEFVFGLQSAWVAGPDSVTYYAQFQQSASGVVNMRTKDGVNTLSASSGVTMVVDTFHIFRSYATDATDVRFLIAGVEMGNMGQFSFAATGVNAILQPD